MVLLTNHVEIHKNNIDSKTPKTRKQFYRLNAIISSQFRTRNAELHSVIAMNESSDF